MEVTTGAIIGVITALAGAVVALWKQNRDMQTQISSLLSETKCLMGGLTELVRGANTLMVEVKDVMKGCKDNKGS